jgi:hypothetical protein
MMPGVAALIDFGIDNNILVYSALQYGLKHKHFTEEDLQEACGSGPMLTKLVNRPDNPYGNNLTVKTAWDDMPEED